ncbi:hypothetical protein [Escherichia coli]|uniref:hypothetical protein n=1 Tax=Escherichia coli TaxID=562 RepID=UPI001BFC361C|nr:hypothetical protein [Escherichia coli]
MRQQRIIIDGFCEYEMLGLGTLLKAENYDVKFRKETEPTKGDILIIAMSAMPLLNWLSLFSMFRASDDVRYCRTICLVPKQLKEIQRLFATINIIDGSRPWAVLKDSIIKTAGVERNETSTPFYIYKKECMDRISFLQKLSRKPLATKDQKYYYWRSRLCTLMGIQNVHILSVIIPTCTTSFLMNIHDM